MTHSYIKGIICSKDWDLNDGTVLCRTLGLPPASAVYFQKNEDNSRTMLRNVNCTGSEVNIADCAHDGWGKRTRDRCAVAAGVVCGPPNGKSICI